MDQTFDNDEDSRSGIGFVDETGKTTWIEVLPLKPLWEEMLVTGAREERLLFESFETSAEKCAEALDAAWRAGDATDAFAEYKTARLHLSGLMQGVLLIGRLQREACKQIRNLPGVGSGRPPRRPVENDFVFISLDWMLDHLERCAKRFAERARYLAADERNSAEAGPWERLVPSNRLRRLAGDWSALEARVRKQMSRVAGALVRYKQAAKVASS